MHDMHAHARMLHLCMCMCMWPPRTRAHPALRRILCASQGAARARAPPPTPEREKDAAPITINVGCVAVCDNCVTPPPVS